MVHFKQKGPNPNNYLTPLDQHVWGAIAPQGDLRSKIYQKKLSIFNFRVGLFYAQSLKS
jgi:hypothetical protein